MYLCRGIFRQVETIPIIESELLREGRLTKSLNQLVNSRLFLLSRLCVFALEGQNKIIGTFMEFTRVTVKTDISDFSYVISINLTVRLSLLN